MVFFLQISHLLRINNFLDTSLSIHLSSELQKLSSYLFLRALPVFTKSLFGQFWHIARMVACAPHSFVWKNSMVSGAQACMRAICINWQNGLWVDKGNALRNKYLFSLCKSDDKWMLRVVSSNFSIFTKKYGKKGELDWGGKEGGEMSKNAIFFFFVFFRLFWVNLSKKQKFPFLTPNRLILSP